MDQKKVILSGIQPSGIMTIGNYLGAIKNWGVMQDEYDCLFMLADLHTLTVKQEPARLRANTYELTALYLACGLDPEKSVLFLQSHVPAHAELSWILNTVAYPGELSRMTQFKDKCARHADNINMGLMDYPVLMAADILLYQADVVPIGIDQKQHLELTRDLAMRFNNRYGDTFKIPEAYIGKVGAKIYSLQDPEKKMSKSDENLNAFVSMDDDTDTIMRKFKRAVTDSGSEVRRAPDKPGVTNLINIYSLFAGKSVEETEKEFENAGYAEFKRRVGEAVAAGVEPIRREKDRILSDKGYIDKLLASGAERAAAAAERTLRKVYKKVGLLPRVKA